MSSKLMFGLIAYFVVAMAPAFAETALLPGDAKRGKTLHAANCVSCHDSKMYTRKNRRVQTLSGLIGQVEGCNTQLQKALSKSQVDDITAYLNETYYRFE
jgi:mono/diheme cytochrome c family protein